MPSLRTFLCHASADKPAVETLAHEMSGAGIGVWLDRWNLVPGQPWQEAIEQALEECDSACVFIGPGGIGPWQSAEMRACIDRRVARGDFSVIPVRLPGSKRGERGALPALS